MGQARATLGTSRARTNRARGWGVPEAAVGERQSTTQRRQGERGRAIVGKSKARLNANAAAPRRGATAIQPPSWDFFSHKPLGAGKRNWRAVGERRTPTPNAAAPRLLGQRLSLGRTRGLSSHEAPKGAARRGLIPFSLSLERAKVAPRRERDNPTASLLATRPPTTKTTGSKTTKSARAQPSAGRLAALAAVREERTWRRTQVANATREKRPFCDVPTTVRFGIVVLFCTPTAQSQNGQFASG